MKCTVQRTNRLERVGNQFASASCDFLVGGWWIFLCEPAPDGSPVFMASSRFLRRMATRGVAAANLLDLVLHTHQLYFFSSLLARQSSGGWTSSWKCFSPFFVIGLLCWFDVWCSGTTLEAHRKKKNLISRWAASRVRLLIARQLCWSFFFASRFLLYLSKDSFI